MYHLQVLRLLAGDNKLGKKFPFILVTNGGGITEEESVCSDHATQSSYTFIAHRRCYKLTKELGVEIRIDQLIQSHTVFRELVEQYKEEPVLVLGGRGNSCREVAHSYGFRKCYTSLDLLSWRPEIWPLHKLTNKEAESVKASIATDSHCT